MSDGSLDNLLLLSSPSVERMETTLNAALTLTSMGLSTGLVALPGSYPLLQHPPTQLSDKLNFCASFDVPIHHLLEHPLPEALSLQATGHTALDLMQLIHRARHCLHL